MPRQNDGWRCGWYMAENVHRVLAQHARLHNVTADDACGLVGNEAYDVSNLDSNRNLVKGMLDAEMERYRKKAETLGAERKTGRIHKKPERLDL